MVKIIEAKGSFELTDAWIVKEIHPHGMVEAIRTDGINTPKTTKAPQINSQTILSGAFTLQTPCTSSTATLEGEEGLLVEVPRADLLRRGATKAVQTSRIPKLTEM